MLRMMVILKMTRSLVVADVHPRRSSNSSCMDPALKECDVCYGSLDLSPHGSITGPRGMGVQLFNLITLMTASMGVVAKIA